MKPDYWEPALEPQLIANNIKAWLTVRNDDWFFLHWADPQFVRDSVNNFPEVGKYVHGINIGPDGWVFTKEFTSKNSYYQDQDALDGTGKPMSSGSYFIRLKVGNTVKTIKVLSMK